MEIARGSFSGHETFPFRYAWMKKGIDAVTENPTIFSDDTAMTVLGVGKNMVRSIRHWCLAAGLIEGLKGRSKSGFRVSALGQSLFSDGGFDPYLEDPATLWILHWQLACSQTRATTWFWAFNHVHEPEFTKDTLLRSLKEWIGAQGLKTVSEGTLERDIDCFLRTYSRSKGSQATVVEDSLDCPLVELGLLATSADHTSYAFGRGDHLILPTAVLFYAICSYWQTHCSSREALSLVDLAHRPGSPGRVFKFDEGSLSNRLEQLEKSTRGGFVYDETAGLKQLYRKREPKTAEALKLVYRRSLAKTGC